MSRVLSATLLLAASAVAHAIPEGPEPNTPEWFEREAGNFARQLEGPQETVASPDFELVWNTRSTSNRQEWIDRALADPSWVGYPSGNSPNTPAGAMWSSVSTSDPTRYPDAEGPNGHAFYETEGEVQTVVFYDRGCARVTAKVWAPRSWHPGDAALPGVVIQNGSIQASQTMYWWFAQALVRAGYVVMTFDPRGQGRSDLMTPAQEQGGNVNSDVFYAGMVDAIDFFRASPALPYARNAACAGSYPTVVADYNPFAERLDLSRLGIAGHSLGAAGISSVQGYPGTEFQSPDATGGNPVDVLVAWDSLGLDESAPPRVPAMGQTSEYGIGGAAFVSAPDPDEHLGAFAAYKVAGVPAFQLTLQGSTHFEWSLIPGFPTTSWCADLGSGSCQGGFGVEIATHHSLAWMDRWLKLPGDAGYEDADSRLLDDATWCDHYSFYFRSARTFPDRAGGAHDSTDVRADCVAGKIDAPAPVARDDVRYGGAMNLFFLVLVAFARVRRALVIAVSLALVACGSSEEPAFGMGGRVSPPAPPAVAGEPSIKVLSNRANLISAGDALVEVVLPIGATAAGLTVDVDGRDVSDAFAVRANGRVVGLVTGLLLGDNVLTARLPGRGGARIALTNHPQGGPVFAGPQIQPWTCAAGALDAQCNREPTVTYQCMSNGRFVACDPESPPAGIASTTTDQGVTVPYIVRVETGAIDRDEYRIAVLYDPTRPLDPAEPQPQFNHKLVITHGASCDTAYEQGSASDVMNDAALSRGFAVMSNALNNSGHNCNVVVQAESMVMTKERVIDSLGEIRYTIGSGCSGGALAQYWMANAYPGLYQGISPACSFADAWSSAIQYVDYELLRRYFEDPTRWATGVVWTPVDWIGVYGHPNPANPITFTEVIPSSGNPSRSCPGVPAEQVYNAQTNPTGVRCSLHDYTVNVFGRRPEDGFAGRPADNVGVQFGLKALEAGSITAAQFVDLNHKIGSWDIDYNETTYRTAADRPALEYVYRSGSANVGNNLDQVAIIDLRGPDPGAFHDAYRAYALRARLDREHGHHDNQLIWRGPVALLGDATFADEAILALDKWLAAVEADTSDRPLAEKLLADKPADVVERCTNGVGVDVPAAFCDAVVIAYTSPRIEAGMPYTDDVVKCQLKPLDKGDYSVTFTDDEWARLQETFPDGVCDYSKPGVDFGPTVPWLDYTGGPGGIPMGEPPVSLPLS